MQKEIVKWIDDGKYAVGDRLPSENTIAELTSTGRSSVREAIRLLSSVGILTVRRGSGTYVASTKEEKKYTASSLINIMYATNAAPVHMVQMRAVLERAVVHFVSEFASDEQLQALDDQNNKLADLMARSEPISKQNDVVIEFRRMLAELTTNPIISTLYKEMLEIPVVGVAELSEENKGAAYLIYLENRRLVSALKHRNTAIAESAINSWMSDDYLQRHTAAT